MDRSSLHAGGHAGSLLDAAGDDLLADPGRSRAGGADRSIGGAPRPPPAPPRRLPPARAAPAEPRLVASGRPLQLGQITGDPWADWALQVAGAGQAPPLAARALRRRAPSEIRVHGEPVVAFRAPDGSILLNGEGGPIR